MGENEEMGFLVEATYDEDGVQASSAIGFDGKEYPDPQPMAPPVGYKAPPSIIEMIRSMIHNERFNQALDEQGFDTADEADDFDIEDDPLDPLTPYERHFFPAEKPKADPVVKVSEPAVASPPAVDVAVQDKEVKKT